MLQLVWEELFPFADKKALKAARMVGLREHPQVGLVRPSLLVWLCQCPRTVQFSTSSVWSGGGTLLD